jgi:hypothetical protein
VSGRRSALRSSSRQDQIRRTAVVFVLALLFPGESGTVLSQELCEDRVCDTGQIPDGCGPSQTCDMFRNLCVADCTDADCCRDVVCPGQTQCIAWRGQCGLPAGDACFDIGATRRAGLAAEAGTGATAAATVDFVVHNATGGPLYFQASSDRPVIRFELYGQACGVDEKLDLPENEFCPNWCPVTGPVQELDCRRPEPVVFRLAAGEATRVTWSGYEVSTNYRVCRSSESQSCMNRTPAPAGRYAVEICSYTGESGGELRQQETNLLNGAVAGAETCIDEEFDYPDEAEILLDFTKE